MIFGWVKVYRVKGSWYTGYWVEHEGKQLTPRLGREDARNICGLLNGAYNIGRSDGAAAVHAAELPKLPEIGLAPWARNS